MQQWHSMVCIIWCGRVWHAQILIDLDYETKTQQQEREMRV